MLPFVAVKSGRKRPECLDFAGIGVLVDGLDRQKWRKSAGLTIFYGLDHNSGFRFGAVWESGVNDDSGKRREEVSTSLMSRYDVMVGCSGTIRKNSRFVGVLPPWPGLTGGGAGRLATKGD